MSQDPEFKVECNNCGFLSGYITDPGESVAIGVTVDSNCPMCDNDLFVTDEL